MASEDNATEAQIKRLYAVLHSVGLDPKQWKKDQNIASYAKLTRAQCSAYIDEVEALEAELNKKAVDSYHIDGTGDAATEATLAAEKHDRLVAELQKIREEQGLATSATATPEATVKENLTIPELIHFYVDVIAQVTVAVEQEDRIPKNEKGYATNWVANAIKDALNIGGNHEEQV